MNHQKTLACLSLSFLLITGCKEKPALTTSTQESPQAVSHGQAAAPAQSTAHKGIVLTTMTSGGYTYMEVEENEEKYWIASPQTEMKVGDTVYFPEGAWMMGFKSKTLDRTFDKILFVGSATKDASTFGKKAVSKGEIASNLGIPAAKTSDAPTAGSITKAEGGFTVSELYEKKKELNGTVVKLRGRVVKVSTGIMGKNWVHIKDGTGAQGTDDITFTSKTELPEVGSTVLAEGTLAADKDFGAGYLYAAIVENSKFTK